jgi:hypothetical protein
VWAGLGASFPRAVDDPSSLQNVGHDTPPELASANDILVDVGLPASYASTGLIKGDGNLFAVLVNHVGAIRPNAGCSTTQTNYKTSEPIAFSDVVELTNNDKYVGIGYGHSAFCTNSFVSFGTKTVYYLPAH